jgi:hypothetical protein
MTIEGTIQKEEKLCLECLGPLGPGREDRKYCSDACRVAYHNRRQQQGKKKEDVNKPAQEPVLPDFIQKIQAIQLRNREILSCLSDEERVSRIRMRDLIGAGFNPKFFTSEAEPTDLGHIYRFCFEYGYWEREDGVVTIVCRPREVIC